MCLALLEDSINGALIVSALLKNTVFTLFRSFDMMMFIFGTFLPFAVAVFRNTLCELMMLPSFSFFYKLTLFESGVEFTVVIVDVGDFYSGPLLV